MKKTFSSMRNTRMWAIAALGLTGGALPTGCGDEPAAEPASAAEGALRRRFPEPAAQILEQGEAFVDAPEGFVVLPRTRMDVQVVLPRAAQGSIRLTGFGGATVSVRELGATGESTLAGRAVKYARAGGTSFWTAAPGGVEEWLHLEASAVHADEPVAAWEVDDATVRQRGESVEIVDDAGVVRLAVAAPVAYGEGGRTVPVRLVASGSRLELRVDAEGEEVLVDPVWTTVGSLAYARSYLAAAPVGNSKVVIAGGRFDQAAVSADVYDTLTNSWTVTGPLLKGRYRHTATGLKTGNALFVGGWEPINGPTLASAELYNPTTNQWTSAGSMGQARADHTATLLDSGRVLVTGGSGSGISATAELYEPATNSWLSAGAMAQARTGHTATQLANGKVLIAGGQGGGNFLASAEIYDPMTNTWSPAASMIGTRTDHTATLLLNGKVLVTGGYATPFASTGLKTAELYDPAANTWVATPLMPNGHHDHFAARLSDGKVLVVGGGVGGDLYDPVANTWSAGPAMGQTRYFFAATQLPNGELLAAGGFDGSSMHHTSVEIFGLAPLGSACILGTDCKTGFCVDGVCCNTACDGGPCDGCSVVTGAAVNGTCVAVSGVACDDGNACTQTDACQAGTCVGGNALVCEAPDACNVGVCDPATGMCGSVPKANGSACDDGDACTQVDACQAGVCGGTSPVLCDAPDQCHTAGACDPATGLCPVKADGTACDDGNGCSENDVCQAGVCGGTSPVLCDAPDQCHTAGACDPATGLCPVKADGTAC
ncbi:kelch repeat-containing protein, partial [Polyangium sp. 6x1]|uniref:Kelch repeat-containing protein n=1 Tax=Polyangium sp. 6x1 TaxID=3042689 RepID=UPI00248268DE